MNCPVCDKAMRKVRWELTNNFRTGKEFQEYDKITYECRLDDVWVSTEIPVTTTPGSEATDLPEAA